MTENNLENQTSKTYEDLREAPWEYLYENYLTNKEREFYNSLSEGAQESYRKIVAMKVSGDTVTKTIESLSDVLR